MSEGKDDDDLPQPRTEPELRQLAMDIADGKVFGSWMRDDGHLAFQCVTALLPPEALQKMLDAKVAGLYEYYDKAEPRGINGMPAFFSYKVVLASEAPRLDQLVKELYEVKKKFLEGDECESPPSG